MLFSGMVFLSDKCAVKDCSKKCSKATALSLPGCVQLMTKYHGQDLNRIPICDTHSNNSSLKCTISAQESKAQSFTCAYSQCTRKGKPFVLNRSQCAPHSNNIIGSCESILNNIASLHFSTSWQKSAPICSLCLNLVGQQSTEEQISVGIEVLKQSLAGSSFRNCLFHKHSKTVVIHQIFILAFSDILWFYH